jgi:hypothetical protein
MLNQDGDSSEEDEDIVSKNVSVGATSLVIEQKQQQQQQQKKFLLPQADDEDEEEDEDAPLPSSMQLVPTESIEGIESEECIEALHALEADCWDINSWILFIDEVEAGRGGSKISIPDAYNRFLDKFPRAAKQWKALAEFHTGQQEYTLAEEVYNRCLGKCRNVELWLSYVQMIRLKFPLEANQRIVETAYEKAVDNIGMSLISNPLWRSYIDFITEWPDSDTGRKLGM